MAKLNWQWLVVRAGGKDQSATCSCGSYAIAQVEGGSYAAVFQPLEGEAVPLVEAGSHGVAYSRSVAHHKANHAAAVEAGVEALATIRRQSA